MSDYNPGSRYYRGNQSATITHAETIRRTKAMVAWDTGRSYNEISVNQDLTADLNYTDSNKAALEGPIESFYFADVKADASTSDLKKATTVGNLAWRIFNNYIPAENRE